MSGRGLSRKHRKLGKPILALALLLLASSAAAFAGIHPVPLKRDTPDTTCLECHLDKTEGKHVHPAVAMGCLTCHLIRTAGETTRVNLKTARIASLCRGCHEGKQGSESAPGPSSYHAGVHKVPRSSCFSQ